MSKKQVYIAGPIADPNPDKVTENINRAADFGEQFLVLGWSVIIPHTMYRFCRDRHDREVFLESDFEMVRRADALFLCPGWEQSKGTLQEIKEAEYSGTTVLKEVVPPSVLDLADPICVTPKEEEWFREAFWAVQKKAHENARDKGWWAQDKSNAEMIALLHSELSEALEADRQGNPPDDKIPDYTGIEAELADVIIRAMDMAQVRRLDLAQAVLAKMAYNRGRLHMHGGKKY